MEEGKARGVCSTLIVALAGFHHSLARPLSAPLTPFFLSKPLLRLFLRLYCKSKISSKS